MTTTENDARHNIERFELAATVCRQAHTKIEGEVADIQRAITRQAETNNKLFNVLDNTIRDRDKKIAAQEKHIARLKAQIRNQQGRLDIYAQACNNAFMATSGDEDPTLHNQLYAALDA